jgi:hypothetical protein
MSLKLDGTNDNHIKLLLALTMEVSPSPWQYRYRVVAANMHKPTFIAIVPAFVSCADFAEQNRQSRLPTCEYRASCWWHSARLVSSHNLVAVILIQQIPLLLTYFF